MEHEGSLLLLGDWEDAGSGGGRRSDKLRTSSLSERISEGRHVGVYSGVGRERRVESGRYHRLLPESHSAVLSLLESRFRLGPSAGLVKSSWEPGKKAAQTSNAEPQTQHTVGHNF